MKYIIIAMLLSIMSFARAGESPVGIYQIDPEQSTMVLFKEAMEMNGLIDINADFKKSNLTIDTQSSAFESTEFIGTIDEFQVKGYLTHKGTTRLVTLKSKYLGNVNHIYGKNKVAFTFQDNDLDLKIIATKPSVNTVSTYNEVNSLIYGP
jgi:polyisoprenoid-binding protein YceI